MSFLPYCIAYRIANVTRNFSSDKFRDLVEKSNVYVSN